MENAFDLFMETIDNPNDALTRNGDGKKNSEKQIIDIFNEVADTFAVHPHHTHTRYQVGERRGRMGAKPFPIWLLRISWQLDFVSICFAIFTARRMEFHHRLECIFPSH